MTIKDIAKECGCGVGTVSRVLNNHPDVSEQMREKVLAVVNKHDFVINQNAKLLKIQDRKNIVIIVKGNSNILLNQLLEIIQKRIEQLPYTADVVIIDEYDNEVLNASRIYLERKPLGMIFLGGSPDTYKNNFSKLPVPCIVISNQANNVESSFVSSISTDDEAAAYYATEYLIKKGHKKIGVIGGDLNSSNLSKRRYKGFLKAMQNHSLDFDFTHHYSVAKYSFDSAAHAAAVLTEQYPDMTAIFTMADVMAVGAIRELRNRRISVPDDVSVTGFDGLPLADFYCPRITTIRQQISELAEDGLDTLLRCIEWKIPSSHKLVPFEFVEGESVRSI